MAESFFSSLKRERIMKHIYKNRDLATADVADYIDSFYNGSLRHSHMGGGRRGGPASDGWAQPKLLEHED